MSILENMLEFNESKKKEARESKHAEFIRRLKLLGINTEEIEPALLSEDNTRILSVAGSGKTTFLILKLIYDKLMGLPPRQVELQGGLKTTVEPKILVCTFLKTGAEELGVAFDTWVAKLHLEGVTRDNIVFKTIHAEVYQVLKEMGLVVNLADDATLSEYIKLLMQKHQIRAIVGSSKVPTIDEVRDIQCIVTYARNRMDEKKYRHSLMSEYTIDSMKLDMLLADFAGYKRAMQVADFEDLQEALLEGLRENKNVVELVASRYDYIYIDELQDTSQLQYEILKYYASNIRRIVGVGDDDQCIYSWRGADLDIILEKFVADFQAQTLFLTYNYRTKKNILNAVVPSINQNTRRVFKNIQSASDGGEINLIRHLPTRRLGENVKENVDKGYTVGVVGRTNNDLIIPAMLLVMHNMKEDTTPISFTVSKAVGLTHRIPTQVLGCMDLILKRHTPEFEKLLGYFVTRYYNHEVKKVCEYLRLQPELTLLNVDISDLRYNTPHLAEIVQKIQTGYAEKGEIGAYLQILDMFETQVYTGGSMYAKKAREFVRYIKMIIKEHPVCEGLNLAQVSMLFDEVSKELNSRKHAKGMVKITTVHEAKGKEWDCVHIWNDAEGAFPNVVGKRELTEDEYEEERRLHYIAWTRAKDKLYVYSPAYALTGFLTECDLQEVKEIKEDTSIVLREKPKKDVTETLQSILTSYINKLNQYEYINTVARFELEEALQLLGEQKIQLELEGVVELAVELREGYIQDKISSALSVCARENA